MQIQTDDFNESNDDTIKFPAGELTSAQLKGIIALLPVDVTFIDADDNDNDNDNIKFFVNNGGIFARPKSALSNKVFEYHPPEVLPPVRAMLADFKAKKRDRVEIFRTIKSKSVSVVYQAVYGGGDEYLGTVEFVQNFSVTATFRSGTDFARTKKAGSTC